MKYTDKVLEECPFLKEIIENKIQQEVDNVKIEKDREIEELKENIKNLTAVLLIGGDYNV